MPRMRVTGLGRQHLYLTRQMIAADGTAEIEPQCVEAARTLGYVEDIEPGPVQPARRRGRPPRVVMPPEPELPKPQPASEQPPPDELDNMTNEQLRELAEGEGHELPSGYVKNDDLIALLRGE